MKRRVVVTGMGAVTPLGNSVKEFWENLLKGISGADYITHFDASKHPTNFACEVKDFQTDGIIEPKEVRKLDLFCQYAIVAAHEAIIDSGMDFEKTDTNRVGVVVGSGIGGITTFEREFTKYKNHGARRISPFFIPQMIIDIASGHISMKYNLKGPNYSVVSACATASHAIGNSFQMIQRGDADVMVTGGAEAAICEMGVGGFNAMRAISTRNDEPKKASRPFEKNRDGFVIGEGSGILILEELEHAKKRGAK
ncbi:MAG TPA: beta-ketoacyl-[acyl-carrier-protein] synthase II, partial [Caldithrix sp.]|nr:beta-ketoacyl-[acyl-carrier-protein] synthase II [Caldithrix sp.]